MAVCRRPDGSDSQTSDGAHQQAFLCSNIADSTFHHPPGGWSALSLQNGKLAAGFLFVQLLSSYPFLRRLSALLLQSHWVARSRESDKILADSNPAGICRPMNPQDPHRQQITFAAFPFLSRTGNVSHFSLCAAFAFLSFHLRTASRSLAHHYLLFFPVIYLLNSLICLFLSTCGPAKRVCPPPTSNLLPRTYLLCPSKTSYHKESTLAVRGFYLLI